MFLNVEVDLNVRSTSVSADPDLSCPMEEDIEEAFMVSIDDLLYVWDAPSLSSQRDEKFAQRECELLQV